MRRYYRRRHGAGNVIALGAVAAILAAAALVVTAIAALIAIFVVIALVAIVGTALIVAVPAFRRVMKDLKARLTPTRRSQTIDERPWRPQPGERVLVTRRSTLRRR